MNEEVDMIFTAVSRRGPVSKRIGFGRFVGHICDESSKRNKDPRKIIIACVKCVCDVSLCPYSSCAPGIEGISVNSF